MITVPSRPARHPRHGASALLALLTLLLSGTVLAGTPARAESGSNQAATPAATAAVTAAATIGASDAGVPGAVTTAGAGPVPSGVIPVQTGGPAAAPAAGGGTTAGGNAGGGGSPAASGGSSILPWLAAAIVAAGLAALAVYLLRRPAPAVVPVPVAGPPTAGLAAATVATPVAPEVRCPNCDTLNPPGRRFCDECGQDLRPALAAAAPAAPAVDEATLPYLETLSRVDDQLEFVLARDTVTIGRAAGNDIVIDDQFLGWQTVSPRHARLTKQAAGFMVQDLESENGTFVNGGRTGENLLEDGMTIAVGKVEFVYRVPQS